MTEHAFLITETMLISAIIFGIGTIFGLCWMYFAMRERPEAEPAKLIEVPPMPIAPPPTDVVPVTFYDQDDEIAIYEIEQHYNKVNVERR